MRKVKSRKQRFQDLIRNEMQTTTTHGIPYLVNSKIHWFERCFWAINFLACVALIFILLTPLYQRFTKSPSVMSVEMDYFNWNVSFPAITLCPEYGIHEETLHHLARYYMAGLGMNLTAVLLAIARMNFHSTESLHFQPNILKSIPPEDYSTLAAWIFKSLDNSTITTNTDWPITVDMAMTEMGMCHVINSNVAAFDNPIKWRDSAGTYSRGKTDIVLSVHDADFFTQIINYGARYRIYIHNPDEVVHTSSPTYNATSKGYLTIGVRVWSTRISDRLSSSSLAVRKCRFQNEPVSARYPVYSYSHCILECRINMIKRICGCVPHFYKTLPSERICSLNELACVSRYKKELMVMSLSSSSNSKSKSRPSEVCGCLNNCESDVYQTDVQFIALASMDTIKVGLTSFPKVRVVRDVIFSVSDVILRSGGVVNLCIGTSLISLMEVLIVGIKILIIHFKNKFYSPK